MEAKKNRKVTGLSVNQKLQVLDELGKGINRKTLAERFDCNLTTIMRISQQEEKYRKIALANGNVNRKRFRKGIHDNVDRAVSTWFCEMRTRNGIVTGPMVLEQAKKFALMLKVKDFEPSNGWLHRWKKKENINFQKIHGEKNSADQASASEWIKNQLPELMTNYEPSNIFNADESGLFYKALPSGTLAKKGDKVVGGKTQKERLTLLFLTNMNGTEKTVYAIGKAKNPHCFRGKQIPLPYYSQNKSWMTNKIWVSIIKEFDSKMLKQKRKVLLLVDNAACHKLDESIQLTNVDLKFLPANTTSIIQPLDQGIIRCFKAYYRQNIVRRQLLALERGSSWQEFTKSLNILEALKIAKRSWWLVTPNTIKNCFTKAGFHQSIEEGDEEVLSIPIPDAEFEEYIACDDTIQCYGELSEEDILQSIENNSENDSEKEDIEDDTLQTTNIHDKPQPSRLDALEALHILRSFLDAKDLPLDNIELLEVQLAEQGGHSVQKKISDYFN